MPGFWQIVASNSLLVALLAVGVLLLGRIWKNPVGLHLLWVLVLLKLVTPPMVMLPAPWPAAPATIAKSAVGQASSSSHDAVNRPGQAESLSYNAANSAVQVVNPPHETADPTHEPIRLPWLTLLGWLWGVGVGVFALRQAYRIIRFRRLLRAGEEPSPAVFGMAERIGERLGLRRIPRVRMLSIRISPLVWSLLGRPQVLLPAELFGRLDADAQEAILTHELAHVPRGDHWTRLLELFSTTLFWWHPVVWWACRELRELEDQCCDALAVGLTSQGAKSYATALLDTLDFLSDRPVTAPLGATAAKPSVSLARRIAMLKNHSSTVRLTFGRLLLVLAAAALPMTLAFGAKPPQAANETASPKPAPHAQAKSSQVADGTPQVVIQVTGVDMPRDWDFVRQLPSGGVILSEPEAKKLIEKAQRDTRAKVTHPPRIETRLGWNASLRMAVSSGELRCLFTPEAADSKDAVVLQIKPEIVKQGLIGTAITDPKWCTSISAELKTGEAVAFGGWERPSGDSHEVEQVTVFLVQARYAEPSKSSDAPAVQRRAVNKQVKDFPEKLDLSTPESAAAAFHRVLDSPDPKGWLDLSAWTYTPRDVADISRKTEAHKDELEKTRVAYRNAEIVEVLEYQDGLAEVISKLDLGEGSRDPYSARSFVRINGVWKNFGENRLASLEGARKDFDRRKEGLWAYYLKVLDGFAKGKPVRLEAGDLSSSQPKRSAPIAPGEPLGISVEKADLMGRVEWAMMHGGRDVTARKTIEWGDVEKDENGNRTIRYKFEATIWGKDVVIANRVFTFDAKGNILDMEDVEGFPQKKVERPADVNTQTGMKELVEDFFTKNFHDITSRETIEWGQVQKDENGNSSIRYKYRAKIWDKETKIMNQIFTFNPMGGFVAVKDVAEGQQKP